MPRSRKSRYADVYRLLLRLLIEARTRGDFTQVEVAKRMGTSQSMLSKLERGVVRMDLIDLLDYLRAIKTDPREFLERFLTESAQR